MIYLEDLPKILAAGRAIAAALREPVTVYGLNDQPGVLILKTSAGAPQGPPASKIASITPEKEQRHANR